MRVLVLNPGSSTLKYRLVDLSAGTARTLAEGMAEHVADDGVTGAAAEVVGRCRQAGIEAVGCRVVHGGEHFAEPALVTPNVLAAIRELGRLAPLHNPVAADVLASVLRELPGVPVVAV